jgi:hypothetical protein
MARKTIRLWLYIASVLIAVVLVYEVLWGKLFPFSPVFLGFSKHELKNTIVYVQNGAEFSEYAEIDSLTLPVEEFHGLKFIHKPRIFIFRDKDSYYQKTTSKARFCAYPSNSLVVSPWAMEEARNGKISLVVYLRHEMSHILLYQYKDFLHKLSYPNWYLEGVATYSAGQMGTTFYPGKDETYRLISQGNFLDPRDFKTSREDKVKINFQYRVTFFYSEFACMIGYLDQVYERDKLLEYIKKLTEESNHDKVFKQVYGIDFDQFILNFKAYVGQVTATANP